jgi:hypothetical protein
MPYARVSYVEGTLSTDELKQIVDALTKACLLLDCNDPGGKVLPTGIKVLTSPCGGSLTEPRIEIEARAYPSRHANWDDRKRGICRVLNNELPVGVRFVLSAHLTDEPYYGVGRLM